MFPVILLIVLFLSLFLFLIVTDVDVQCCCGIVSFTSFLFLLIGGMAAYTEQNAVVSELRYVQEKVDNAEKAKNRIQVNLDKINAQKFSGNLLASADTPYSTLINKLEEIETKLLELQNKAVDLKVQKEVNHNGLFGFFARMAE